MQFHVITLFPEVCQAYTDASVLGRAQKAEKGKGAKVKGKKIEVKYYNPREFTKDKHKKTDDRPYGGGPGMIMKPEPVFEAMEAITRPCEEHRVRAHNLCPDSFYFCRREHCTKSRR